MKLAVMKVEGHIRGGGFHYMLHPFFMKDEREEDVFRLMGHIIIEVLDTEGVKLLMDAKEALNHQYHVAILTERKLKEREG